MNLKGLRKRKGLTQNDVATQMHVDTSTLRRWEHGSNISMPNCVRLAKIYTVSLDDIVVASKKSREESK